MARGQVCSAGRGTSLSLINRAGPAVQSGTGSCSLRPTSPGWHRSRLSQQSQFGMSGTDGGQPGPRGALGGAEQVGPHKEHMLRDGSPSPVSGLGLSFPALCQQVGMSVTPLGHQPHGLFPLQLGLPLLLTASPPPATTGRSFSHSREVTELQQSLPPPDPQKGLILLSRHSSVLQLCPHHPRASPSGRCWVPHPRSPALQPPGCHQGWLRTGADVRTHPSVCPELCPGSSSQQREADNCGRPTADWEGQTARLIREYLTPVKGEKHAWKAKCFSENKLNLGSCQAGGSESSTKKYPTREEVRSSELLALLGTAARSSTAEQRRWVWIGQEGNAALEMVTRGGQSGLQSRRERPSALTASRDRTAPRPPAPS